MLLIGEPQAVAEPVRILGHLDRQGRQPQHGIGGEAKVGFQRRQAVEQRRPRRNGKHERDQSIAQHGMRPARARAAQPAGAAAPGVPARPTAGQSRTLGNAGGKALGVGQALAILGGQTEEAQDAQVVLADALPWRRR